MKNGLLFFVFFFCLIPNFVFSNEKTASSKPELTIYAYDSFLAKGGLGRSIFPIFEKHCSCRIRSIASGDAGQMLTRVQLDQERGKPAGQIILGVDHNQWSIAQAYTEPWQEWNPKRLNKIGKDFQVGNGFLPFDYGAFSFIADTQKLAQLKLEKPTEMQHLLKDEWKRNLILEDPRSSAPGLAFLLYSKELYGQDLSTYWKALKGQWITLAPGWNSAYSLFLKGEAPLVWSYISSQAYHRENGDENQRYQALIFNEGQPVQIEGAALVKNAFRHPQGQEQLKIAKAFLEFLISEEVQKMIPQTNWMHPVVDGTPLPISFRQLPKPKKLLRSRLAQGDIQKVIQEWQNSLR